MGNNLFDWPFDGDRAAGGSHANTTLAMVIRTLGTTGSEVLDRTLQGLGLSEAHVDLPHLKTA